MKVINPFFFIVEATRSTNPASDEAWRSLNAAGQRVKPRTSVGSTGQSHVVTTSHQHISNTISAQRKGNPRICQCWCLIFDMASIGRRDNIPFYDSPSSHQENRNLLLLPFLTFCFLWMIPKEEKGTPKDCFGSFWPKPPKDWTPCLPPLLMNLFDFCIL